MEQTEDMNREGAETYLRLLGEAELRGQAEQRRLVPEAAVPLTRATRMTAAAGALVAVGVIDAGAAADIVADLEMAMSVRGPCLRPERPGPASVSRLPAGSRRVARLAAALPVPLGFTAPGPVSRGRVMQPFQARHSGPPATGRPVPGPLPPGAPERIVPAGVRIPFRDQGRGGELYLMSYVQTPAGARFNVVYGLRGVPGEPLAEHVPAGRFGVTDDQGRRYRLEFMRDGGPGWVSILRLEPAPPADVAWLDVAAPGDPAVRISLGRDGQAEPEVQAASVSPGESLLIMMAERLLAATPELSSTLRRALFYTVPGAMRQTVTGFGEMIAALEAADALSPLSPLPGQLAGLCAALDVDGHGIAAPPAAALPEPWISVLTHYQRRKPDQARAPDGFVAVGTALPELDGIRLAVLGLESRDGSSSLHVLARGLNRGHGPGQTGLDFSFPLSVWIHDSGGRWHCARAASWHPFEGEHAARLHLRPALPAGAAWIELVASGQSAQVRVRLPLHRGYAP
jgi:hypothetical protein